MRYGGAEHRVEATLRSKISRKASENA